MPPITSSLVSSVSLRLLGGASVERSGGVVTGRGTRGPRLALLAMLATARGRPLTRDKLVATLWPEANADRARPLLSDSLYMMRSALGDDAIIASGDELRLNGERVSSDVETFERLLGEEQFERAVAEYAGPFLDGFHLAESAEFERWIESERARLAERYADALGALAAASEEARDWPVAVSWLRRLAAHEPYAGRVAVRLMRALQAEGNRAGALQHARVHAALLREEFGADPDAEVAACVEELKSEPSSAPPSPPLRRPDAEMLPLPVADFGHGANAPIAPSPALPSDAAPSPIDALLPQVVEPADPACAACPPSAPVAVPAPPRWHTTRGVRIAMAVLALIILAGTAAALRRSAGEDATPPASAPRPSALAPQRSIAVLPFDDLGPGRDDSWFSDGLTEEIIGLLGRVEGLRVAARSSSFALRDARLEARGMGDTLRVATLLEGSVRREGDRMRVTARLVDVANGYQIWTKSYDRRVADVIALQRDIATAIVEALQLQLGASVGGPTTRPAHNPEAYDLYLRGTFARNKLGREDLAKALDYFDRAIRLDSTYAPAWAGKATTVGPLVWNGGMSRTQGAPLIRAAARRAVELDESLTEAHVALGMTAFFFDWDWALAEREFRRAIELNPNDALAHHFLANYLRAMGRFDEMIAERTRALELDPLSVRMGMMLGSDYLVAGQYELAATHYRRASELEPRSPTVLGHGPNLTMGLGHVYERQGKLDAAVAEYLRVDSLGGVAPDALTQLRRAYDTAGIRGYWRARVEQVEREQGDAADPVHLAWMWSRVGDMERTARNLERAHGERSLGLVYLAVLPDFAAARADPRVAAILAAMRLDSVGRSSS